MRGTYGGRLRRRRRCRCDAELGCRLRLPQRRSRVVVRCGATGAWCYMGRRGKGRAPCVSAKLVPVLAKVPTQAATGEAAEALTAAVVRAPLLLIDECFVRRFALHEALFCVRCLVDVRVKLDCALAIRGLYLLRRGALGDAEDLVERVCRGVCRLEERRVWAVKAAQVQAGHWVLSFGKHVL